MSMMRLLSAGRSLVGGRQSGKRLQMVDVRSLPKFGTNSKLSSFRAQTSVRDQSPSIKEGSAEKAPSTKRQAPEKLRTPDGAFLVPRIGRSLVLGAWILGF